MAIPSHRSWRSGLFSTGYNLVLPWKCWPSTEKVRVIATLVLGDGRAFEAERDVTVHVAPPEYRKPILTPTPVSPPAEPVLPVPPISPEWKPPSPQLPTSPEWKPPSPLPDGNAQRAPTSGTPTGQTRPAAYWQRTPRTPLADGVELLTPMGLPQRREWGP